MKALKRLSIVIVIILFIVPGTMLTIIEAIYCIVRYIFTGKGVPDFPFMQKVIEKLLDVKI